MKPFKPPGFQTDRAQFGNGLIVNVHVCLLTLCSSSECTRHERARCLHWKNIPAYVCVYFLSVKHSILIQFINYCLVQRIACAFSFRKKVLCKMPTISAFAVYSRHRLSGARLSSESLPILHVNSQLLSQFIALLARLGVRWTVAKSCFLNRVCTSCDDCIPNLFRFSLSSSYRI